MVVVIWIQDITENWMAWYMCKMIDLRENQLNALGYQFMRIGKQNEIYFLFNNHFIFKVHCRKWLFTRIYIVDPKYQDMQGVMEMNIRNIERQYRKSLYKNIKKSLKDESYLVDINFIQHLDAEIENCYRRYIRMRLFIYGGK